MAAVLTVFVLGYLVRVICSQCQPPQPPRNGLISCRQNEDTLVCHVTCRKDHRFPSLEKQRTLTCHVTTGHWDGGQVLDDCVDACRNSLLVNTTSTLTATSTFQGSTRMYGPDEARFSSWGIWRPDGDDVMQFIEVRFNVPYRITAVRVRGDEGVNHVTVFRLLFSMDGETWVPYTDTKYIDTFFAGNINSHDIHESSLTCYHIAKFVRLNPIEWHGHITLKYDLLGCPYFNKTSEVTHTGTRCTPPRPRVHGVISCERKNQTVTCTFTCEKGFRFEETRLVEPIALTRSCNLTTGLFTGDTEIPPCTERKTVQPAFNSSGFCLEGPEDCYDLENGDYQFCGACHFFATCAEHIFYVRACPAHLRFDSGFGLCNYQSRTCGVKSRKQFVRELQTKIHQ